MKKWLTFRKPVDQAPQRRARRSVMGNEELYKSLNIPNDHPVLRAVLEILERLREERVDAAGSLSLPAEQAKAEAVAGSALADAAEEIAGIVDEARKLNGN